MAFVGAMTDEAKAAKKHQKEMEMRVNAFGAGGPQHKPEQMIDLEATRAHMTAEELAKYEAIFEAIDVDKSGELTHDEMEKMFEDLNCPVTHFELVHLFWELDQDNSGDINLLEFSCIMHKLQGKEVLDPGASITMANYQQALKDAGQRAEEWFAEQAAGLDSKMVDTFEKAGVEVVTMSPENFDAWLKIAQDTSYKNFSNEVEGGKDLIDQAMAVE